MNSYDAEAIIAFCIDYVADRIDDDLVDEMIEETGWQPDDDMYTNLDVFLMLHELVENLEYVE